MNPVWWVQFSCLLCLTLCDPTDCSTSVLPVYHQHPELAQTPIDWVGNDIQPSHPMLSLSSPTFNLSQHHGLFQWVSSLHQVAKVLSLVKWVKWKSLSHVRLFVTHGLYSPWNSPGQNTGVGSPSLLQWIFPTQEWNQGLLHCRWILYKLK